jgi:hypothetical protein
LLELNGGSGGLGVSSYFDLKKVEACRAVNVALTRENGLKPLA